jgi:hypothetical protein
MKKMQEKSKIYNIQDKVPTPPSNQSIWMANTNFQLKKAATKTQGFSMTKDNTPPKNKANHKLPLKPRQSNQTPNSTKGVDSP